MNTSIEARESNIPFNLIRAVYDEAPNILDVIDTELQEIEQRSQILLKERSAYESLFKIANDHMTSTTKL